MKEETTENVVISSPGRDFQDVKGKSKTLRKRDGKLMHTGDSNYIVTQKGVIHHPVNKVFKRFSHLCGFNKIN